MWPPDDYRDPNRDPQRGLPEHPEEALAAFALNALDDAEFQAVFHPRRPLPALPGSAARLSGNCGPV